MIHRSIEVEDKQIIYNFVKRIPRGKVTTYGAIATEVGISPRTVGNILHMNTNPKNIPCHRVVKSDGALASGYAFGGPEEQRKLLEQEGIQFKNGKIDLKTYLFYPL